MLIESTRTQMLSCLFVYGTLRRGRALHGELIRAQAKYIGEASARGTVFDLGRYPGALPEGHDPIPGEIYALPNPRRAFRRLDIIEGPEFRRSAARVTLAGGQTRRAWMYSLKARPALLYSSQR